ncbi:MAG: hypothetical protein Tsb009_02550 [Planctomycetaceae bacterium]
MKERDKCSFETTALGLHSSLIGRRPRLLPHGRGSLCGGLGCFLTERGSVASQAARKKGVNFAGFHWLATLITDII